MAEEMNVGVAYLTAIKKLSDAESGTAVATAPAQEAPEQPASTVAPANETGSHGNGAYETGSYQGVDKRLSPRYKCDGSVQLAETGCDVYTWAKFTDVSLHGCYVEAQATYPVGTSLSMKMELNGVRLEPKGAVRVNYPYLGMGIAFVDMSEENRERLKSLLSTVTHPRVIVSPAVTSVVPIYGGDAATPIPNPGPAMQSLVKHFQNRYLLTRDDFLSIVARSQSSETKC
jgi:hypothetical protein